MFTPGSEWTTAKEVDMVVQAAVALLMALLAATVMVTVAIGAGAALTEATIAAMGNADSTVRMFILCPL